MRARWVGLMQQRQRVSKERRVATQLAMDFFKAVQAFEHRMKRFADLVLKQLYYGWVRRPRVPVGLALVGGSRWRALVISWKPSDRNIGLVANPVQARDFGGN
tara:strand:- start:5323 stop:5631 length:309 start_codon:yes stop_codon:yes gene_type:complete